MRSDPIYAQKVINQLDHYYKKERASIYSPLRSSDVGGTSSRARNISCHTEGIDLPDINKSSNFINFAKINLLPMTPELNASGDDMGPM